MTFVLENLSVRFGAISALEDVSCAATPGKVTAVVGANAAGKSTLLRACTGALPPSAGSVRLDGRRVRDWPLKKLAARMAYVPQQAQLSAAFTVREVVALGRYALPADRARIDWAMESMGVADLAERLFLHLSQGQRQRVTVARALAQVEGDGILVLDEPLSAMDVPHMLETMRLLRAMANHGGTILIALHDLDTVRHFGDHVWLLQGGRLISTGPPADVLSPDHLLNAFGARFEVVHGSGRQSHLVPVFEPAQL